MKIHTRLGAALLAGALSLGAIGCGSSQDDFVVTGSAPADTSRSALAASLKLGLRGAANAPFEVRDSAGGILARGTTDAAGNFVLNGVTLPSNFRLVATVGNGVQLSREVRGFTPDTNLSVTIASTLVSELMQRNSELTLPQAEEQVAGRLGLERGALESSFESEVAPFSQLAFLAAASEAGGWQTFLGTVLDQIENGQAGSPFLLSSLSLDEDFSGLDPALASVLEDQIQDERFQMVLKTSRFAELPDIIGPISGEGRQTRTAAQTLPSGISAQMLDSLLGTIHDQVRDVVWTHIADGANFNYGTTAMLEEVQAQLDQVQDSLDDLQWSSDNSDIATAAGLMSSDITNFEKYNTDLTSWNLSSFITATPQPQTPDPSVSAFVSQVSNYIVSTALLDIQKYMLPSGGDTTNILTTNRKVVLSDTYGISIDPRFGNYPVRSSSLFAQLMAPFHYYGYYQMVGANLLAEQSHINANSPKPSSDMLAAVAPIDQVAVSLKQQRGQLPLATFDNSVFVDLQAGLMWYTAVQPSNSVSGAVAAADKFSTTVYTTDADGNRVGITYSDWHVPSVGEMAILQSRGAAVTDVGRDTSVLSDGDSAKEKSVQGLAGLGFTGLQSLDKQGDVVYASYAYTGKSGDKVYSDGSTGWEVLNTSGFQGNTVFQLNQFPLNVNTITSQKPYFLVRSIGTPVVPASFRNGTPTDQFPFPWSSTLQNNEFLPLGYVSGILSMGGITLEQLQATLNISVTIGGSFSAGGDSYDYPDHFYAKTFVTSTADGPNKLNELVFFDNNGSTAPVTVKPSGRMYWHVDNNNQIAFVPQAQALSPDGTTYMQATGTVTEAPPVREFLGIGMYPRNQVYNPNSVNAIDQYCAIAYYSDYTIEDVTDQVVWSLIDSASGQPVDEAVAEFSDNTPGSLTVRPGAPGLMNVTATMSATVSDTTQAKVTD